MHACIKNVHVDVWVGECGQPRNVDVGAWERFQGVVWLPTTIDEPHTFAKLGTSGNNKICGTCVVIMLLNETKETKKTPMQDLKGVFCIVQVSQISSIRKLYIYTYFKLFEKIFSTSFTGVVLLKLAIRLFQS